MIPWDFGVIDFIRKNLGLAIFPSSPPESHRNTPYLIFELKKIIPGRNLMSKIEFVITVVDDKDVVSAGFEILKSFNKIISNELTLSQGGEVVGTGKFKINSIESKKNNLILNFIGLIKAVALYEEDILEGGAANE